MTRKARQAAKHAAGVGKGQPTPKRPPQGMSRARATTLAGRRRRTVGELLRDAPGVFERAQSALQSMRQEERIAIEKLARDAGGVDLSNLRRSQGR